VALSVQALYYRVGLSASLERSGSGRGWHLWLFFRPGIPARKARQLGYALVPYDAELPDGELADPGGGKGIEVFPKCDGLREGGVGNQVWLPWFWGAKSGGNLFYRHTPRAFEPFVPEDFDVVTEAQADRAVARLGQVGAGGGGPLMDGRADPFRLKAHGGPRRTGTRGTRTR
jgi:hypothetical protein